MKSIYFIVLFLMLSSCSIQKRIIVDKGFENIVKQYIKSNQNVLNKCNSPTHYGISFSYDKNDTLVQIEAFLGEPGLPIPLHPDSSQNTNYEQRKGFGYIDNHIIVIYDYVKSKGYGLYDEKKLENNFSNAFDSLHDSCINVKYPGPEIYKVSNNCLIFIEKLKPFQIR